MTAYYNEYDPFAAAWLRELVADNLIAPGEVDERDIRDVTPDELRSFRQCHFFAGIGIWSAALRGAGWPDDREVWTASCPCQPFSQAGQGGGFDDERHLWPAFYHLASQRRPAVVFGEQVASKDGLAWIDLVSSDMEAAGYAGGAFDLCSAGFGAPNIRQRLYFVWMADAGSWRLRRGCEHSEHAGSASEIPGKIREQRLRTDGGADGATRRLADAHGGHPGAEGLQRGGEHRQRAEDGRAGGVADASGGGCGALWGSDQPGRRGHADGCEPAAGPGPANGFWRDADWIGCTDGKWRPVRPGSFPLVARRVPNRMGLLRGAGNAINKEVAQGFIAEVRDMIDAGLPAELAA